MLSLLPPIVSSLTPAAFVIILGWWAGRQNIVAKEHSHSLATYVMNFSFPCTLFVLTATSKPADLFNGVFIVALGLAIISMFALSFVVYKMALRRSAKDSVQGAFVCSFADMAFMGIPIFTALIGKTALLAIAIGNICTSFLLIPLVTVVLASGGPDKIRLGQIIKHILTKPLVLAPLLGTGYSFLGWPLPGLIQSSLSLLGNSTSGVSLFALGLIMSSFAIRLNALVLINVFLKNIVHPLIMLALVTGFGIKGLLAQEAVLLCAMPTACMATMFALKYQVLAQDSTSSTILGTLVSLLTLPLFMMIMGF